MKIKIEKAKGYSGKKAQKSWVAMVEEIRNGKVTERDFLDADSIDWGDSKLYKKSKGIWTEEYELTAEGIYEVVEYGERKYLVVYDGGHKEMDVDGLMELAAKDYELNSCYSLVDAIVDTVKG